MKIKWNRLNRDIHYWGAISISLPLLIVIVTGILLLLKKEIDWVQPPSVKGIGKTPHIEYSDILTISTKVPEANIQSWSDIKRLDFRISKGIVKVQSKNQWELQIDTTNGQLLSSKFRRSDIIESIHDGSFFHDTAKLGLFLPSAIVLLILWVTGIYLFIIRQISNNKKRRRVKNVG